MRSVAFTALVALALATASAADGPATRPNIPLGPATTYLTGPLRADGTVDYVKGLDELRSKGVTNDNNAFRFLLIISGADSHQISPKVKEAFLKRLDLEESEDLWTDYKPLATGAAAGKEQELLWELRKTPWQAKDHPSFAAWLKTNDEALKAVTEASRKEKFYIPMVNGMASGDDSRLIAVQLPSLGRWRNYANALSQRAMMRLGAGDAPGCVEDLLTTHRLARLLSQGGTVIERLVGTAIETQAGEVDGVLATSGKLTAPDAAAYLAALDKLPDIDPMWHAADQGERCTLLDEITRVSRKGRASLEGFAGTGKLSGAGEEDEKTDAVSFTDAQLARVDYAAALKQANALYDRLVAAMKVEDSATQKKDVEAFDRELQAIKVRASEPDAANKNPTAAFGDWIISMLMPSFGRAALLEQRACCRTDLGRVALALAACHAATNAYPDQLETLVPKYLAKIPPDRFGGQPLHYVHDADHYLLYSIGPDLKDDGGTPWKGNSGDFVIETPKN